LGTVPVTAGRDGLIRSANPVDTSGNLVVTGNVAGGRHFRGSVPYTAGTDVAAALGSSSLDSFLRRSAAPVQSELTAGRNTPFYSPTGTVSRIMPGSTAVMVPHYGSLKPPAGTVFEITPTSPYLGKRVDDSALKSLAQRLEALESDRTGGVDNLLPPAGKLPPLGGRPDNADDGNTEQPPPDRIKPDGLKDEKKHDSTADSAFDRQADELKQLIAPPGEDRRETLKDGQSPEAGQDLGEMPDVLDQLSAHIEKRKQLRRRFEPPQRPDQAAGKQQEPENRPRQTAEDEDTAGNEEAPIEAVSMSARARAILGEHEDFESFAAAKLRQLLRKAEEYLKAGRYYHAAETYALASSYGPDSPEPLAGRAMALFAAGEYVSSSLFISRAIKADPEYLRAEVDINLMIPDRDRLESMIVECAQWQKKSGSGRLQLILAYVYYRLDMLEKARNSAEEAFEPLPDQEAAAALRRAIHEAIESNPEAK